MMKNNISGIQGKCTINNGRNVRRILNYMNILIANNCIYILIVINSIHNKLYNSVTCSTCI